MLPIPLMTPIPGLLAQEAPRAMDLAVWIPVGFVCLVLVWALGLKLREFPSNRRARHAPTMTPQQVETLMIGNPPRIIDLRPREDFGGPRGHIRGAISIPADDLPKRMGELSAQQRDAILLVDDTDELSHRTLPLLINAGHPWVYVLKGGMRAWRRAKLPLYRPARPGK